VKKIGIRILNFETTAEFESHMATRGYGDGNYLFVIRCCVDTRTFLAASGAINTNG